MMQPLGILLAEAASKGTGEDKGMLWGTPTGPACPSQVPPGSC